MASEKSPAIVLRVVDFSETSCVVTLFSRDFGKLSALAKGARRPKSPFEGALDLLAVCRIVFLRKSSDALDLLTEARLERRFRSAARDLARLYAGYYVAELLRDMTDNGDPHPELFDAAETTLMALDSDGDVASWVLRFEMLALSMLGHMPLLDACAGCGRPMASAAKQMFGFLAGGVLCSACRPHARQVAHVSAGVIELLKRFSAEFEGTAAVPVLDRQCYGELRGVLNHYLAHVLGHRPRMHEYLGTLHHARVT